MQKRLAMTERSSLRDQLLLAPTFHSDVLIDLTETDLNVEYL